ncbi:MAG: ERF family protein [Pseudomonadota bacterium]
MADTAVTTIDAAPPAPNPMHEPVALPGDPMMALIEKVIMSPDLPMDRIQAAMDIRERQMDKVSEQQFNAAFAAAMAEMPNVARSGTNKHLQRSYSTLDDLIRASRAPLAKHGLSLNWQTGIDGDNIWVKAIVRHSEGHSISTEQRAPRDKSGSMNLLQGGGSTETYLKRYTGFALLGLASGDETDDDGQKVNADRAVITEDQYITLQQMIDQAGIREQAVLDAEKIMTLTDLPASKFDHVRKMLQVNIDRKAHT